MENYLKRRDYDAIDCLEDEESADLDVIDCLLPDDRIRNHEYDSCLISPYKRLRVEELTHSSAESQAGEGEAHSLLRSSDEADVSNDIYHQTHTLNGSNSIDSQISRAGDSMSVSQLLTSCSSSDSANLSPPALARTSNGHVYEEICSHDYLQSADGEPIKELRLARKGTNTCHMSCCAVGNSAALQNSGHFDRPPGKEFSIPYIDEICLEKGPEVGFNGFTSSSAAQRPLLLVRSKSYDYPRLTSYPQDFPVQESEQISCHPGQGLVGGRSANMSNDNNSRVIRCPVSIDLLEIHAGDIGDTAITNKCKNSETQHCRTSNFNKNSIVSDDEDHYQTIEDAVAHMVFPSNHSAVAAATGSVDIFTDSKHPNLETFETANDASDFFRTGHSRSVGTTCSNIPSRTGRPAKTTTSNPWDADDVSAGHNMADADQITESSCGTAAEVRNAASTLLRPTGQSGMKDAAVQNDKYNAGSNYSHKFRYSSHQELTPSSRDLDPSSEPRSNVCRPSSWDNVHHQHKEDLQLHQRGLERQHSSGSSVKSHLSSIQPYHVEELQVHLPGPLSQGERDLFFGGIKDFAPSVRSSSSSSRGDLQHQHFEGTQNQQQNGTSQNKSSGTVNNHSAGSVNQHSAGSVNQHSAGSVNQHSAGSVNQHIAGSVNQHIARSVNQHIAESVNQHSAGSVHQHSAGTVNHHSAGSANRHSWSSQTSTDQTEKSYPSSVAMNGYKSKKTVFQSSGHLKISAYWNAGLLTIHVIKARCMSSSWKSHCDSYVKMSLVPDETRRTRCKTRIQLNTNNPIFDEKFSLEILEEDRKKRLLISVWHKDPGNGTCLNTAE